MDEQLIIEVWDIFKDYIPEKSRDAAANQYVDFLLGKEVETDALSSIVGYDPHLDSAIDLVVGVEDEYDEDDWDYEEDEE